MRLILITPEKPARHETKSVNDMFSCGLQLLHLRKPDLDTSEIRKYIQDIDPGYHSRIVVNGHFELYKEFGLNGIHINGSARRDAATWEKIKDIPISATSTSYHSWSKIKENDLHYRYVLISPVYDSLSKKDYKAVIDIKRAKDTKEQVIREKKYCPDIIGLGGIGTKQMKELHSNGFDGVAILGSVWMSGTPVSAFIRIQEAVNCL